MKGSTAMKKPAKATPMKKTAKTRGKTAPTSTTATSTTATSTPQTHKTSAPISGATAKSGNGHAAPHAMAAAARPTVSHMLGELTWLLTQSATHKHFALADLEWMIMPPLVLEQYRVFRGDKAAPFDPTGGQAGHGGAAQTPLGYATWAYLSEAAEAKLNAGHTRLRPGEWKSGERLWLVDLVAPFASAENKHVERMLSDLVKVLQPALASAHGGVLKFHKTDPKTGQRQTVEVKA